MIPLRWQLASRPVLHQTSELFLYRGSGRHGCRRNGGRALELLHEHQRSIWNLDRRRLEITIDGHENAHATKGRRKRFQVAAGVAVLLCVGMIGLALAGNRGAGDAADAPRRVIESIRSVSPTDLSCLIGCDRAEPVLQQGRL